MDIRGIEVTNQLRSAIRAKLLELGVRYDEELPDYILVMVVNKKTRQQMHEDLHLFLEDSTTPFVEWLHDQVLKKLQKVTIAKKKATREFVPTVIVKQEEERKKRKNILDSEIQHAPLIEPRITPIVTKVEKPQKIIEKTPPIENPPVINATASASGKSDKNSRRKSISPSTEAIKSTTNVPDTKITPEISSEPKNVESRVRITTKRPIESAEDAGGPEKRIKSVSIEPVNPNKDKAEEEEIEEDKVTKDEKRLKSCINKPKITSVVSVKNRLGIVSPKKKFETHRARGADNRYRQSDRRFEKTNFDSNRFERNAFDSNRIEKNNSVEPLIRRSNFQRVKNFEDDEIAARNRSRRTPKANDGRNRSAKNFDDKVANSRIKTTEKQMSTVKNRLGVNRNVTGLKQSIGEDVATRSTTTTIKNRLGPFRDHISVANSYVGFVPVKNIPERSVDGNSTNMEAEDDPDDYQSVINVGPVKSHVIALKRPEIIEGRSTKMAANVANNLEEDEDVEGGKSIASKVIVTPRPLKPLQPAQKRATQSLLLRAVAEANQSVVKQKNPEPVLSDKKPKLRRPKPPGTREINKNLSVHLNATKRLVMEKIQVQLRTTDSEENVKNPPHPVNDDEHIGLLMSLFQRSDDNQKFLVTLNGYNNNVIKEKNLSDEEDERLEMEVTEEDEIVLSNVRNDSFEQKELSPTITPPITEADETQDCYKVVTHENNENHNSENVEIVEEVPHRKRRKLSPIIYTRTKSPHQSDHMTTTTLMPSLSGGGKERVELKSIIEAPLSTVVDKSREKCRYWPNCTLGSKCVYHHPAVPCGVFPACKFGDKCAYKHPKCKFGLSCTKLGCVFSHPKQQCKYHPFCTKPTCLYSHPQVHLPVVPTETIRTKFTWKRRD